MKQRIITAIFGIPLVLLVIFGPPIIADVFIALVGIGMVYEYLNLIDHQTNITFAIFLVVLLGMLGLGIVLPPAQLGFVIGIMMVILGALFFLSPIPNILVFGTLYLSIPLTIILNMRLMDQGIAWVLLALFITWATDIMALFGGKAFGKRKLAPSISPGKTIEGTAAGIISGIVACFVVAALTGLLSDNLLTVVLAAILLPPMAVIGDLVESRIKRMYGKKDSGTIIPGHGGLLDRVDSLLATFSTLWLLILLT